MTTPSQPVLEGVFAIDKPTSITSFDVIRNLQPRLKASPLFAPLLSRERAKNLSEPRTKSRHKRDQKDVAIKIGHGGTLDPLATGVLVIGIGSGTKTLNSFLECTKSYECVVLFGAATDSYDSVGKIVQTAPFGHVTKHMVEHALQMFKGKIMQKPPIFSSLRVNGKRMHEYAREGGDIPEVKERPVEVLELEMVEWLEPGTHDYDFPSEMANAEQREMARKLMKSMRVGDGMIGVRGESQITFSPSGESQSPAADGASKEEQNEKEGSPLLKTVPAEPKSPDERLQTTDETHVSGALPAKPKKKQPPAAKLRMTVTSGFYVRSLCHDLGIAVESLGLMSSLVRTRQGEFELGKNVLEFTDLEKDEEVWGSKIKALLEEWQAKSPSIEDSGRGVRRDHGDVSESEADVRKERKKAKVHPYRKRRNSSSVEE